MRMLKERTEGSFTVKNERRRALKLGAAALVGLLGLMVVDIGSAHGASASEPGLTPTTVTVGSVATITGPVPGLLQGAPYGAAAYFAMINSEGGVNGRKLVQKVGDDALNCTTATTVTQNLVSQVFAFVGSMSAVDNCIEPVMKANPQVPYIGWLINANIKTLPNVYDPQALPLGFETGELKYYKAKFPQQVKHVAILYQNNPGTVVSFKQQVNAMNSVGWNVVYSRGYGPTETDFTSDILRMKSSGVQVVWLPDVDIPNTARLMQEAQQQNFHPLFIDHEIGYDPQLIKLAGSAAQNLYEGQPWVMYNGQDASRVPAVKVFLKWMKKTQPSFLPDSFSLKGWAAAEAFVNVLKAEGANPTQAATLTGFSKLNNFNADGLLASSNVGNKQPEKCYVVIQYRGSTWHRVAPTNGGAGFQCNPTGFAPYSG
jgi:ABC-type branched-subunit amino acid transport system substrate-binding protein